MRRFTSGITSRFAETAHRKRPIAGVDAAHQQHRRAVRRAVGDAARHEIDALVIALRIGIGVFRDVHRHVVRRIGERPRLDDGARLAGGLVVVGPRAVRRPLYRVRPGSRDLSEHVAVGGDSGDDIRAADGRPHVARDVSLDVNGDDGRRFGKRVGDRDGRAALAERNDLGARQCES